MVRATLKPNKMADNCLTACLRRQITSALGHGTKNRVIQTMRHAVGCNLYLEFSKSDENDGSY